MRDLQPSQVEVCMASQDSIVFKKKSYLQDWNVCTSISLSGMQTFFIPKIYLLSFALLAFFKCTSLRQQVLLKFDKG